MSDKEIKIEDYYFDFPNTLIAKEPAKPRDSAKLLIYNRKKNTVDYDTFKNIGKYLPEKTVLVFNETKVIPARLILKKETLGKVAVMIIERKSTLKVIANKKIIIGQKLFITENIFFTAVKKEGSFYFLESKFTDNQIDKLIKKYGVTPIPPYIKTTMTENSKRREYQTVFAKYEGSIAAPTASLHFTKSLLKNLEKRGIIIKFITLHVGMGTFFPLNEDQIIRKKLHKESYFIDEKTALEIKQLKLIGWKIITVGTTALRTLETVDFTNMKNISGSTELFITPQNKPKFIDGLITNFHVPKSSLLILVSALIGREKTLEIYNEAIIKKMRLFSFGDGMLII